MRLGNLEIPGGLLIAPAIVLVAVVLLLWSWYYHSEQKREMMSLATSRGWKFLGKDPSALRLSLDEMETETYKNWRPANIILIEVPPNRVYMFNYQVNTGSVRGTTQLGAACLAERPARQRQELVLIDRRPRFKLTEKLLEDSVQVGEAVFRREFLVRCPQPDLAAATVTTGVQEVLLRQTSGLKWDRVWIAGGGVLVTVTWSLKPEEWDELLGMSKRLLAALP